MDQETKKYIDQKFAEQSAEKTAEQRAAQDFIAARKKRVMWIVFTCAGVLLLLFFVELYILYTAQLRGFR